MDETTLPQPNPEDDYSQQVAQGDSSVPDESRPDLQLGESPLDEAAVDAAAKDGSGVMSPDQIREANEAAGVHAVDEKTGVEADYTHHEGEEGRSMNVEKALREAAEYDKTRAFLSLPEDTPGDHTAANEARDSYASNSAEITGNDYEIEALAQQLGKTTEEVIELVNSNVIALLKFGHEIIENQRKFGEKLTPSQEAFDAIAEYYDKKRSIFSGNPDIYQPFKERISSIADDAKTTNIVTLRDSISFRTGFRTDLSEYGGSISIKISDWGASYSNIWTASPFKDRGAGTYNEIRETTKEKGWDRVDTEKTRLLTKEDAEQLKQKLSEFSSAQSLESA